MNFLCNTATFKSYFVVLFIFLWYPSHLLQVPKHILSEEQSNEVSFYLLWCITEITAVREHKLRQRVFHKINLLQENKLSQYRPWCLTYIASVSSINIYFLKLLPVEEPMPAARPTGSVWKESQGQRHLPGRQAGCSGEDKAWCVQQRASREAQRQSRPKRRRLQHSPKHRRVSGPAQGSREL